MRQTSFIGCPGCEMLLPPFTGESQGDQRKKGYITIHEGNNFIRANSLHHSNLFYPAGAFREERKGSGRDIRDGIGVPPPCDRYRPISL